MKANNKVICLILCCLTYLAKGQVQDTDCNPDGAGGTAKKGEVFLNFGSTTNAFASGNVASISVGQQAVGESNNEARLMNLGFWTKLLLPPLAPDVVASMGEYPDRVLISWQFDPLSAEPSEGFIIERDGAYLEKVEPGLGQYIDFNVQAGENYIYSVKGVNSFGIGNAGSSLGFVNPNGIVSGRITTKSGTAVAGVTIKLDPVTGSSLLFDGISDHVCISHHASMPTTEWTISAYVKFGSAVNAANNGKFILDLGSALDKNMYIKTLPGNTAGVIVGIGDNNAAGPHEISYTLNNTLWHQVSAVYGGGVLVLYVDGNYIGSVKRNIVNVPTLFTIGSNIAKESTSFFKGNIDDVRIYNRALSQSEIMFTADITPTGSTDGLVAYWKFDEGIGTRVFDLGPNDIQAYINGADFSTDIPNISSGAVSDDAGFYTIEGINYSDKQSFKVIPSKNFYKNYAVEFNATKESRGNLTTFDIPDKSCIEVLAQPFDVTSKQSILSNYVNSGASTIFNLFVENGSYKLTINNQTKTLGPIGTGYNHISLNIDVATKTVLYFLNGGSPVTITFTNDIGGNWAVNPWRLGYRGNTVSTFTDYYTGLIDEVAFFDTLLTLPQIQLHASASTTGGINAGDNHLLSYFPLNEGLGIVIEDFGPKMSGKGKIHNATFTPNAFRVEAFPHEFSPGLRQVNINPSNTAVSMIDFIDVSTIAITGVVRFSNTFCFNKEVEILVNGVSHTPPIFTDANGEFAGEFDPGISVRLTPKYEDHIFIPAFYEARSLLNPIAGVLFQNTTKRSVEGTIWGGKCKYPVINTATSDRVIFELRADNDCFVVRDTVVSSDGKYSFTNIPAIEYSIGIAAGSTSAIFNYFNTFGGSPVDLRKVLKDTIDFEYLSPPQIEISGNDNHMCTGGNLNKPLFYTGVEYKTSIRVYEPYLLQRCYLDSSTINVTNNVAGLSQRSYEMVDGKLQLVYPAGTPNFISPFSKTISVAITTTDGRTANGTTSMVIAGEKRLPTAVLSTNPPIYPFFILRDPPGDGSYATLEANKQVCREFGLTGSFETAAGVSVTVGSNFNVPLLGLKLAGASITGSFNYTNTTENDRKAELCVSLNESVSTPATDDFIGSDGDTYVGAALNIGYGKNLRLAINEATCALSVDTTWSIEMEGFGTDFVYTEKHIKEVVIPLAEAVGDDFTALRWNQLIQRNAELKSAAKEPVLSISVNGSNVPSSGSNIVSLTDRDGDDIPDIDDDCPWYDFGLSQDQLLIASCLFDYDKDELIGNSEGVIIEYYGDFVNKLKKSPVDNCPTTPNPNQADTDHDGKGDACDEDIDGDGILNTTDNCDYTPNANQLDSNGDGIGDACEGDLDRDGFSDFSDNCPNLPNTDQRDSDNDKIGDACERDTDQDGLIDDVDPCPRLVGIDCVVETNLNDKLTLGDVRKNITFSAGAVYTSAWAQDSVLSASVAENIDENIGVEVSVEVGDEDEGPLYSSVTGNIAFNWGHGQYESNNAANSTVVSYTLTDDDPGDFFTVDILSDTRYKTPVFRLKGGDSSCPYEGPPTRNRDEVNFEIDRNFATNVGENDKAIFYLDIGNVSPTDETRTYIIKPVAESNPDGATILIGGQSEQTLTIKGGKKIRMIMTVEKGPVEFVYDSLRIAMYAECEYDGVAAADGALDPLFYKEIAVDVQFIEGCSDVDIAFPFNGWVVTDPNPLTSKLTMQLNNYDEMDPELVEIRTQYRLVGGSGIWINIDTIPKAQLGPADTYSDWFVNNLSDGNYDIRAVSFCSGGLPSGSSDFITGRLERHPPELLGSPEPADGVLAPGDEISITFNEDIRCNEIFQADGIGTNINYNNLALFDLTTGKLIKAEISCLENKIVIVPDINNKFIENHNLKVILHDIKDLAGNKAGLISWEFYVNRSNLFWAGPAIEEVVLEGNMLEVTREIRNQGGALTTYKIENIPDWMDVFPSESILAPGAVQVVHFVFPSNLVNGKYLRTLELTSIDGIEELDVNLRVICPSPEWEFNPSDYSFSMNMTMKLNIEGVFSEDKLDKVGAFINGELRGLSNVQYQKNLDEHMVFLTVYSNSAAGSDSIQLRIWDASECQLYGSTTQNFAFVADSLIGSPLIPKLIYTNNRLLRKIQIHPGWNWISYNLNLANSSVNAALSTLTNPADALIKGQTSFSSYADSFASWIGDLDSLSFKTMYQYNTLAYDSITLIGPPASTLTPLPLVAGWNWIGYLPQKGLPVSTALASLTPSNGDIIKSQLQFAQFVAGFGWIGNLSYMSSPNGYLIKLSNPGTLIYPAASIIENGDNNALKVPVTGISDQQTTYLDDPKNQFMPASYWTIKPENFEYSMNMIAVVESGSFGNILKDGDEVGVFAGNEVRGIAKSIFIPAINSYILFMTIYSNAEGELLTLKYYSATEEKEYDISEKLAFRINSILGQVETPEILHIVSVSGVEDEEDTTFGFKAFPNPAADHVCINFESNNTEEVNITVTDILGRIVENIKFKAQSGNNRLEWKPSGMLINGQYLITLKNEKGTHTLKMEILR